jgi:hypothetical protein
MLLLLCVTKCFSTEGFPSVGFQVLSVIKTFTLFIQGLSVLIKTQIALLLPLITDIGVAGPKQGQAIIKKQRHY